MSDNFDYKDTTDVGKDYEGLNPSELMPSGGENDPFAQSKQKNSDYVQGILDYVRAHPSFRPNVQNPNAAAKQANKAQQEQNVAPGQAPQTPVNIPVPQRNTQAGLFGKYSVTSANPVINPVATAENPHPDVSKKPMDYDEIWKNTPAQYQKTLISNMKRIYQLQYGWMGQGAPMSFKEFWDEYKDKTLGFNPMYTAGIMMYGNPAGIDQYKRNVNLIRKLGTIDLNKALSYEYAGWDSISRPLKWTELGYNNLQMNNGGLKKQAQDRSQYNSMLQAIKAANPKADLDSLKDKMFDWNAAGYNTEEKMRMFNNFLDTDLNTNLNMFDRLGLNSEYWQAQKY